MQEESKKEFDLIVFGAGISGLGIALAAVRAGYKVMLVEKNQAVCRETSDNTFRIMHGGFRYLQSLDLPRVLESLHDQKVLFDQYPEIVKSFDCLMPLRSFGLKSRWPLFFGSLFYNILTLLRVGHLGRSRVLSSEAAISRHPLISSEAVKYGALLWQDGRLFSNDLLAQKLLDQFRSLGGELLTEHQVLSIDKTESGYKTKLVNQTREVVLNSKLAVNALGPWINSVQKFCGDLFKDLLWARSFNLVVNKNISTEAGLGVEGRSGRLFFIVPRFSEFQGYHAAIGTFNSVWNGDLSQLTVTPLEIEHAISEFNQLGLALQIQSSDVLKVEVGILPIKKIDNSEPIFYGQEQVRSEAGYIEVLSTKYTTFNSQAERVLKIINSVLKK